MIMQIKLKDQNSICGESGSIKVPEITTDREGKIIIIHNTEKY